MRQPSPSDRLIGDAPAAASAQGLADRRELAFISVERTRMPMVVTDPRQADNPIVLANAAFLKLTGYGAEEVLGRNCRLLQGPETAHGDVDRLVDALREEREATVELLNYRKDGSTFWNQVWLSPVHDDRGQLLYFFGSQLDVTARRRAEALEAAERRLLREVDHRAMNALAIVEGVVRLSDARDPQRYATAIQGRVQALARAHTLLSESGWAGASLDDLLERILSPFGTERITWAGPPVILSPHLVQPLAMVFHELAQNSSQHGALTNASGRLEITWRCVANPAVLDLAWRDLDASKVGSRGPDGFGGRMLRAIVERQLRGRTQRELHPGGLCVRLQAPLDAPPAAFIAA